MTRFALVAAALGVLISVVTATPSHAQFIRTWVSATGDDTSPSCDSTKPCKSLAYALTKTAAGGQISCLSSSVDFVTNAITISKAITIICDVGGAQTQQYFSGTGITISAGANDIVELIGMDIDGFTNGGRIGIDFVSGAALIVQNCRIRNFGGTNGLGIKFNPNSAATLTVENSILSQNGNASGGGGIQITATGSGSTTAFLKNVTIANNFVGMGITSNGQTVITQIVNSAITNNRSTGVVVAGAGVTATISRSAITNNRGASSSGPLYSYLDNSIIGNASNTPLTTVGGYQ